MPAICSIAYSYYDAGIIFTGLVTCPDDAVRVTTLATFNMFRMNTQKGTEIPGNL